MRTACVGTFLSLILGFSSAAFAQYAISARAGLIQHLDGRVLLNEKPIIHKITHLQEVKESQRLRTERGRAEILLTPGVFLRVGEDAHLEMVSSKLEDVRLRLLGGSAVIEADELDKESSITIAVGEAEVRLAKAGLYRLDATGGEKPVLRVFAGEAMVTGPGGEFRMRAKKEMELAGAFAAQKFDVEDTDALDRWSRRRASYLAAASFSAGRLAYRRGTVLTASSWMWNPYYSMYTFLPHRDIAWSPYGYGFYSPRAVYYVYNPPRVQSPMDAGAGPRYNANYGYSTVPSTSGGGSGVVAAAPSSPAAAGSTAPIARGGDTGGGASRR